MLTSREIVPLALVLGLLAAVGTMTVQTRRMRSEREAMRAGARAAREARAAADIRALEPSPRQPGDGLVTGRVNPADLGGLPLRQAALPTPHRDVAEIRRQLAARSSGTYIGDMLAQDDSLLVRWPDRTVSALRVWVQPRASVPNWDDAYPRMVRDVFPEWSAAGFPLRFLHVVDSASADLHVLFTASLPGRQIGLTNRLRDRNGWIVAAEIIIATQDLQGQPFPAPLVSGIARHEVGHALGLGHARDERTVMFPESRTTTIASADRATLHLLYTLPPGSVR